MSALPDPRKTGVALATLWLALWLLVIMAIASSCAPVRFVGITARPESYGGGYAVPAECLEHGRYEPCWFLCSPEIGGGIACGPLEIVWW
jgi:hypothetical protein